MATIERLGDVMLAGLSAAAREGGFGAQIDIVPIGLKIDDDPHSVWQATRHLEDTGMIECTREIGDPPICRARLSAKGRAILEGAGATRRSPLYSGAMSNPHGVRTATAPVLQNRDYQLRPFISFSRADAALGELLRKAFAAAGTRPFLASDLRDGVTPGEGWFGQVTASLGEMTGVVFIATANSAVEHWPTFEMGAGHGRGLRTVSLMIDIDDTELPKPLRQIQGVTVDRSDEDIEHTLAIGAGHDGESKVFWSAVGAREALTDFLVAARKQRTLAQTAAGSSGGPQPTIAQQVDEKLNALKEAVDDLRQIIRKHQLRWNSERRAGRASLDEAKAILESLGEGCEEPRLSLEGTVSQGLLNVVDDVLAEVRRLLDFQVYLDGGKSFEEFWLRGDDVFRKLDGVVIGATNAIPPRL